MQKTLMRHAIMIHTMNTKTATLIIVTLIIASAGASFALYPSLPQNMASHWGLAGEPNGFMTKAWGAFFPPVLMAALFGLFAVLPSIDPLKRNVQESRSAYNLVIVSIIGFLALIHGYALAWNIGLRLPVARVMIPLTALLFFVIGSALPKTKQNWFMGIRTPWTMSSETVWRKTHEHAGKAFQWAALVMLLGLLFPRAGFAIVIGSILGTVIWTVLYSYFAYAKSRDAHKQ